MERLLEIGDRVGDALEVERYLGCGAFSEVYRVRHRFLGRQAMKVLTQVGTPTQIRDLLGEAVLLSHIHHPNIVRVFDAGIAETSAGSRGYITMEYVAGGSLEDYRRSYPGRIPVAEVVDVLTQACAGLATAHLQDPPLVHRDLTPGNILVDTGPAGLRVLISDFGLARHGDPGTGLTSGERTYAFMPPEALSFGAGASPAADVYALGVIGYLLLTGVLPYPQIALTYPGARQREAPTAPSRFNREVGTELDDILLRALHLDRHRRTPDADALGRELRAWPRRITEEISR